MMEYGLIGEKLGHSYSPLIHRVFGAYDYRLYPMTPKQMEETLKSRRFRGLNVTIPYKRAVMPFCDVLTERARRIGSVNTVVNRSGTLYADNTDLPGFLSLLDRVGIALTGKKAVILGSGGTSLTAQAACGERGAREIVVASRQGPVTYDELYARHTDADVLINATPVGMYPNNLQSPVDLGRFPALSGVADVIYNPAKTALLLDAEERGIPNAGGLWMLAAQAWHAAQWFLDRALPEGKIAEAYGLVRKQSLNLALVGMPGSGKSTLGRLAAEMLGKRFVDLDEEIAKRHGPIPEIFNTKSETAFREMESAVVAEYGKESGLVIACGGGAVLRKENVLALRQNAVIAWVKRPIDALPTDGRPLSTGPEALKKMEAIRTPLYRACADFAVENTGSADAAAKRLKEGFDEVAGAERPQPEHAGHPGKASLRRADI